MAKSEQKDIIGDWDEQIELGVKYKELYGNSKDWHTYRNYYRGIFPGYSSSTSGVLPYNVTYGMARALVPNVFFRVPYATVSPRFKMGAKVKLDMHAKIVEAVDNWLLQELRVKREMKTGVLDCYFTNRAFWKLGYDSLYGYSDKHTERGIGLSDTTFTSYNKKGEKIEYNVNVKPGMPWVVRVDPEDVVVPFGVRLLDECPWIAHRVLRPLEDVKADPKYKNTDDLEGTHLEQVYKDTNRANFYHHLSSIGDWVEIWEVRDVKKKEIFAYVKGYDKFIREPEEDVLQIEGIPMVDMTFNEDTQYYWGPSDVSIIEPQQLELNEARTQAMLHRRIALLKFLVEADMIDDKEIEKMVSENVGPVVKVKGKPTEIAHMLQPHIPVDLVSWVEHIRMDVREMLGFGRHQLGEGSKGRRTAREVGIVQLAHEIRLDERRDSMADAVIHVVRKLNQIIFSKWDTAKVVQVVGYDGAKYWVEYTREAIIGEYNVKVDVESMTPTTKKMKREELIQLIGALSKHPTANLDYLLRMLLREYDWIDAMAVLPEAPEAQAGGPMPADKFVNMQQGLLNNPAQLGARVRRTQGAVGAAQ